MEKEVPESRQFTTGFGIFEYHLHGVWDNKVDAETYRSEYRRGVKAPGARRLARVVPVPDGWAVYAAYVEVK